MAEDMFDMDMLNAMRSLTPENDEIGFDLKCAEFTDWLMNAPIDGPKHFVLTLGAFDLTFRGYKTLELTDEDNLSELAGDALGIQISDDQQYHRISIGVLDATLSKTTLAASFAMLPAENGEPVSDGEWGSEEARRTIGAIIMQGAASLQTQAIQEHFDRNPMVGYGADVAAFTNDCYDRGLDDTLIDQMLQRKYLLDALEATLMEAELALGDEPEDDDTPAPALVVMEMLHAVMKQDHAAMLAEWNDTIAEFYAQSRGGN